MYLTIQNARVFFLVYTSDDNVPQKVVFPNVYKTNKKNIKMVFYSSSSRDIVIIQ